MINTKPDMNNLSILLDNADYLMVETLDELENAIRAFDKVQNLSLPGGQLIHFIPRLPFTVYRSSLIGRRLSVVAYRIYCFFIQ